MKIFPGRYLFLYLMHYLLSSVTGIDHFLTLLKTSSIYYKISRFYGRNFYFNGKKSNIFLFKIGNSGLLSKRICILYDRQQSREIIKEVNRIIVFSFISLLQINLTHRPT